MLKSFYTKITEAKTKLENSNLENLNTDIIECITDIQEIKKNMNNWKNDLTRYKNCKNILEKQKYRFSNDFIDMDKVESEWSKLQQILEKKWKLMEEQIPTLQGRIQADESRINERIKKLDNYWNEKNPEKANSPSEALKILNEANTQLVNVKDDYIRNCKAKELLDMDIGDPNRLNPIEEQIASLREVWNALNNIFSRVESYKDTPFVAVNPEKTKKEIEEALLKLIIYLLKLEIMKLLKFIKKIRTNEKRK